MITITLSEFQALLVISLYFLVVNLLATWAIDKITKIENLKKKRQRQE